MRPARRRFVHGTLSSPGLRARAGPLSCLGLLGLALSACPAPEPGSTTPPGARLVPVSGPELIDRIRAREARFVLVNVWATWCGPCREEFPYVQRVTRAFADRGVDLVFVSADFDTEVEAAVEFLRAHDADLPSFIKRGSDQSFIDALAPEWTGSLPFTVIFDGSGQRVELWQGQVEEAELRSTLEALVAETTTTTAPTSGREKG